MVGWLLPSGLLQVAAARLALAGDDREDPEADRVGRARPSTVGQPDRRRPRPGRARRAAGSRALSGRIDGRRGIPVWTSSLHIDIIDVSCTLDIDSRQCKGVPVSRVQLALNVSDLDEADRLLLHALRCGPGQGPPGLRQLRRRRAAAQAGAHRGRRRARDRSTTWASRWPRPTRSPQPPQRLRPRAWRRDVEDGTTCCYAVQDKVWVDGPDGARWEVYTVLADADAGPDGLGGDGRCCSPATAGATAGRVLDVAEPAADPGTRAHVHPQSPCGADCSPSSWAAPCWPPS